MKAPVTKAPVFQHQQMSIKTIIYILKIRPTLCKWNITDCISGYLSGYSCILVLTTSAGCVIAEANIPAKTPQLKCAGAAKSLFNTSVIKKS